MHSGAAGALAASSCRRARCCGGAADAQLAVSEQPPSWGLLSRLRSWRLRCRREGRTEAARSGLLARGSMVGGLPAASGARRLLPPHAAHCSWLRAAAGDRPRRCRARWPARRGGSWREVEGLASGPTGVRRRQSAGGKKQAPLQAALRAAGAAGKQCTRYWDNGAAQAARSGLPGPCSGFPPGRVAAELRVAGPHRHGTSCPAHQQRASPACTEPEASCLLGAEPCARWRVQTNVYRRFAWWSL